MVKKEQRLKGADPGLSWTQCWSWGLSCPGVPLSDSDDDLDVSGDHVGSPVLPTLTTALPQHPALVI